MKEIINAILSQSNPLLRKEYIKLSVLLKKNSLIMPTKQIYYII